MTPKEKQLTEDNRVLRLMLEQLIKFYIEDKGIIINPNTDFTIIPFYGLTGITEYKIETKKLI